MHAIKSGKMGKHNRDPEPAYIGPILKLKKLEMSPGQLDWVVGCQNNIQLHEPQASGGLCSRPADSCGGGASVQSPVVEEAHAHC